MNNNYQNNNGGRNILDSETFLKTQKIVEKLTIAILVLKLFDVVSAILLINRAGGEIPVSTFTSLVLFAGFGYALYKGYRWPLYIWGVGCLISLVSAFSYNQYWGIDGTLNLTIIFSWIFVILFSAIVGYLLFNPQITAYFAQVKENRRLNKEN